MQRDNNQGYYYEDQFMYFNFNGIHSSQYNLFMINKGDNIKIITDTKSKTEFLSPSYQNFTYFLGTTDTQKEFKYNCAAEDLTFAQCGELFQWLKQGTLGFLILDSNPDWGYDAVLENVSDAITTPIGANRYIVEFDVTFKTVGTYLASSVYPSSLDEIDEISSNQIEGTDYTYRDKTILNEYGIPEIDCVNIRPTNKNTNKYTINLPGVCNEYSYVDFYFDSAERRNLYLKINKKELNSFVTYVYYNTKDTTLRNAEFKSKLGFLIIGDTLAETLSGEVIGEQTKGLLSFDNQKPIPIQITAEKINGTQLTLDETDVNNYSMLTNKFICCVKKIESEPYSGSSYENANSNGYRYSYQSQIWYDKALSNNTINLSGLTLEEGATYFWYIGTYNQIEIEVSSDFVPALTLYKHNNI